MLIECLVSLSRLYVMLSDVINAGFYVLRGLQEVKIGFWIIKKLLKIFWGENGIIVMDYGDEIRLLDCGR